ncbi:ABC transporter permease [Caproiciproducens sp. R1]|uniref:ABC transporter permease n=1 Tax=Caproiciproducens sp. R1 TaxID=3435000 RepID=UPI004034AD7B
MENNVDGRKQRALFEKLRSSKSLELSGIICLIIVYAILVQSMTGTFLSSSNIENILKQIVVYGILSCALTFPLINGTFDLSIDSICALGGTCCALLTTSGLYGLKLPLVAAVPVTIVICCLVGIVNGLIVSRTKIDPFVVTLGTQTAVRGAVYIVSNNTSVSSLPDEFKFLGSGSVGGIPISIIILITIFVIVAIILSKTTFGRQVYANGGNYTAAFLSGINVKSVRFTTYVISAGLSAIAGILSTARVGSATPNAATGYATIAISACAIGGISLSGGSGLVSGVFLGALMMGMITNGMNLMYIGSNWQLVVSGLLMVAAVFYSQWFNKFSSKRSTQK